MHISELRESRFLKKEEVANGLVVTIADCYQENVAKSGAPEELKWVLSFNEVEKPMVLNSINGQIISQLTGSEESEGWMGFQIELYNDPTIAFGGKITGGIRVCAPGGRPNIPMQRQQPFTRTGRQPVHPSQQQPMQGQGGVRQARQYQPPPGYNPQRQYQAPPQQQGMDLPPEDMPNDD